MEIHLLPGYKCECVSEPSCKLTEPSSEEFYDACKSLLLDVAALKVIMDKLNTAIDMALDTDTRASSSIRSYESFLPELPKGTETGKYLALDINGSNLRMVCTVIESKKIIYDICKLVIIPSAFMAGTATEMCDFVTDSLYAFLKRQKLQDDEFIMTLVFIPYVHQSGLKEAIVLKWTGGFVCTGMLNQNIVQLMQDAIDRRGDLHVSIEACITEPIGALFSVAWRYPSCRIASTSNDFCNACYFKTLIKDDEVDEENASSQRTLLIDCQWWTFGDHGELEFIRSTYDRDLDRSSLYPGMGTFHKMMSHIFLGELVRITLIQLCQEGLLFEGIGSEVLAIKGRFPTKYISEIEFQPHGNHDRCREILKLLQVQYVSDEDCNNVRFVCECVSRRSANLLAAGLTVLLNRANQEIVSIALDGPIYKFHPYYHSYLMETIRNLTNGDYQFDIILANDGRGRGAAITAAVISRLQKQEEVEDTESENKSDS